MLLRCLLHLVVRIHHRGQQQVEEIHSGRSLVFTLRHLRGEKDRSMSHARRSTFDPHLRENAQSTRPPEPCKPWAWKR